MGWMWGHIGLLLTAVVQLYLTALHYAAGHIDETHDTTLTINYDEQARAPRTHASYLCAVCSERTLLRHARRGAP